VCSSDLTEIALRASLEGGTGVYGNVFRDTNIQTTDDAEAVATELLNRYKNTIVASFDTYKEYTVGTKITCSYSKYAIATDTEFIITKSSARRDQTRWLYSYTIEQRDFTNFSNKSKENSIDFFSKLARPDKVVTTSMPSTIPIILSTTNNSDITLTSGTEATICTLEYDFTKFSKIIINFSTEIVSMGGTALLTQLKTYVDGVELDLQPRHSASSIYTMSFTDIKEGINTGIKEIKVTGISSGAGDGMVNQKQSKLIVQVFDDVLLVLDEVIGFEATAISSSGIDLTWTNPFEPVGGGA